MEAARSSGGGSGESDVYAPEFAETLRFEEEIQSLMHTSFDPHGGGGAGSFTALLGLGPSQAVELCGGFLPFGCSPTFPSNPALLERAARFSVFAAAEDSPQSKAEPADSGSQPAAAAPPQRSGKRKDGEKSKGKAPAKKSRGAEDRTAGEQLPYVHVRARRGQATDSHSLAERARREKINSRMKLLQELVPGCSKISGTALVLEEIINHVQSLQRQVELLSMRLAAVNPCVDMGGIDAFLSSSAAEVDRMAVVEGGRWHVDHHHHHLLRHQHQHQQQEATNNPSASSLSLFGYDGSPVSASLHLNQLKMEL